ncbi:MAG TPA: Gfo/Idh/MocA family oxidoreductase [Planctomycetota bacterium]|jgi:predicted dehydrogenase|nr:Gfo/Idh/MocA family oxidoreductase [Planctomycetota bacterium]OQC19667.1 MAG: Inositol 2-dehydrogenase [Planctomycetes bacterium ADurb.Bin069]HNR97877.1 Gfo/Idh/MocA family oxidoreductase [Planctomycetota bacterium]HNU24596.1 Gfo/Idh/MocA family oxidoreductase [Planctomycetota bacterium]HOE29012.1 Gfo/Idh/MocA family oxidoreductase [Planctomycetota bacterium]
MRPGVNRRSFLKSTAAAGAALGVRAAEGAAPDSVNAAIIGAGVQGQALLNACLKLGRVRIKALCDIWADYNLVNASRILDKHKHEHATYTELGELLAAERGLDAAIIATPDCCHAPQAVACLEAGLHVYCESPMATTVEGARSMARAARQAGRLLQVGFQRRSDARYIHCADKLLREVKLLGRISAARAEWNRPVQAERGFPRRAPLSEEVLAKHGYGSMQRFRNWEWYRDLGGGPLAALSSHQLDALAWLLDARPVRIMAAGGVDYYDPETHRWPDTVLAVLDYDGPRGRLRASLQLLNANGYLGSQERLLGDQGAIILSEGRGRTEIYREQTALDWDRWIGLGLLEKPAREGAEEEAGGRGTGVTESVRPPVYYLPDFPQEPPFAAHLANFFDAIRGGAALRGGPEAGFAAVVAVAKIMTAVETGAPVACAPEEWKA